MPLSLFDLVGIALYLTVAVYIYRKAWFFSFYSFIKFLLVLILSFAAGLNLAQKNIEDIPLTNLQLSLVIQGIVFALLWRFISFKRLFFKTTDSVINLNQFIFVHHIDKILAVFPALIVSFFICFFIFSITLTLSTNIPLLSKAIEDSRFVKPISYKIYFAKIFNGKVFEGIAFKLPAPENSNTQPTSPNDNLNSGGSRSFEPTPHAPTIIPATSTPTQNPPTITPQQNINAATPTQKVTFQATNTPIPTPFPTTKPATSVNLSQAEQDILRITNEERTKNGQSPLTLDSNLSSVARAHSQDMSTRNFFSHINPDGKNGFDRLRDAGISYSTAGENIAGGATADIIMANWMNSAGHRTNILNPSYGKIGIGVVQDSKYGLLATQVFTN